MLESLISGLFSIIAKLGDLILSPLISAVSVLIPDISSYIGYITYYLGRGISFITWGFRLFMIPRSCATLLITIATATISITLAIRVYTLIVKIYNKFKP